MSEAIMVALVTGLPTLIGTVISVVMSNRLTTYKIEELRKDFEVLGQRVDKHNNLVERMAIAEQSTKSAHHRIDELKGELS
ncbi:MAG: hypothetical protein RR843_11575 [Clostridia bacterium]